MVCGKCGYENPEGARECAWCGNALEESMGRGKRRKRRKAPVLPLIIAAAAVLAAGAFFLIPRGGEKKTEQTPATESAGLNLTIPGIPQQGAVSAGLCRSLYLRADGTLAASGDVPELETVLGWTDLAAVDVGSGMVVGLKKDGTVVCAGADAEVSGWSGIVKVSTEGGTVLGLKADGTVLAWGDNTCGQCEVTGWQDIVDISAGRSHSVGVKADGTVVAVGDNTYGQCDVAQWTDIVEISTEENFTVGRRADGTAVVAGRPENPEWEDMVGRLDVSGWTDLVAITTGIDNIYGLKADGTVVSLSSTQYYCGIYGTTGTAADWTDLIDISASDHLLGLKADGTIVAMGGNQFGECDPCRLQPETAEHLFDGGNQCLICGYETAGAAAAPDPECTHRFLDLFSQTDRALHSTCIDCGYEEVREATPLASLEPVRDSNDPGSTADVGIGSFESFQGTEVTDGIKFWVIEREGYSSKEYIDFDLGGSYQILTGNLIAGKDCEAAANMRIKIYLDGEPVVEYTDLTATAWTAFSLDVSGAKSMRILCTTYANAFGHCIVQAYLG